MSEAQLTTDSIRRFRQAYAAEFGAPTPRDELYATVSEGRRAIGLEHWLPLFYDQLDTVFDYVAGAPLVLDARAEDAASQRIALIADAYAARRAAYVQDPARADYKPLPYQRLYLGEEEWQERLAAAPLARLDAVRGGAWRGRHRRLRRPGRPQFRARAAGGERQRLRRGGRAYPGPARARTQRDRRRLERRLARAAEPCARRAWAEVASSSSRPGLRRGAPAPARCRSR